MQFFLGELVGTFGGFVLLLLVTASGGAFFARALRFPGFAAARGFERVGLGALCGFACLPIAFDLAGRFGAEAMLSIAVVLAVAGVVALLANAHLDAFPNRFSIAVAAAWILGVALCVVDWPDGSGGLSHSILVMDYVKHVATTWTIANSGTPPINPTFYDPGRTVSYYYFYYTLTAVASMIGAPLGLSPRHAAYGGAILAGFALFALFFELWRRAGLDKACGADSPIRPAAPWILALLLVGGLDILPGVPLGLIGGVEPLDAPVDGWTEAVQPWLGSALWAPHHLAALCASFVGFLALARPAGGGDVRRAVLAGLAFASATGLSIYVALAAAATALAWLAALLWARRFRDAADLAIAGAIAAALALPWLLTLLAFGGGGAPPISFGVRGSQYFVLLFDDPRLLALARLATLAPFYLIQFGIFALGSFAFWRRAGRRGLNGDLATILALSAVLSLLIGSFVRSTVHNNDLGWRVVMFAQTATFLWTLSAIRMGALGAERLTSGARACLGIGYCTVAFSLVQLRSDIIDASRSAKIYIYYADATLARATLPDEIAAWRWLDDRLPKHAVVQAQPSQSRSYSYGLYGRFPEAVADKQNGVLYGAPATDVQARIDEIAPLFSDRKTTIVDLRKAAAKFGISALIITALDPVFEDPAAWPARLAPDFANEHARVFLMPGRITQP